jgi:hypothetical protein
MIRVFNQAASDSRSAWQPSLPLELAFIEALSTSTAAESTPPTTVETPAARAKTARQAPMGEQAKKSPPAEPPAGDASGTGGDGGDLLKLINENWRQILAAVHRHSPNTAALLRSGRLLGMKDGVLYFGLSEVLKSKMEKSENIVAVEEAIKQVLSTEVQFRCVISGGKGGGLPPEIDGEGMVASALRDLGGEIVDIQ